MLIERSGPVTTEIASAIYRQPGPLIDYQSRDAGKNSRVLNRVDLI